MFCLVAVEQYPSDGEDTEKTEVYIKVVCNFLIKAATPVVMEAF